MSDVTKNMTRGLASLILLLCWTCAVLAQTARSHSPQPSTAQPFSLDEAVRIALQHPALKEAEAAVDAAEAEVRVARSSYFPQLSFSGIGKVGLSGATSALGLPGFPASPFFRNTAYSVNWYQSVFDFGRIKHLVEMDRALARNAQFRRISEEQRIVLDVRRAYFAVLEAQRLEQVGRDTVLLTAKMFAGREEFRQPLEYKCVSCRVFSR